MRGCIFIALVSALWMGCQSQSTPAHTLSVGMPLREAERMLDAEQAKNITKNVGILIGGLRSGEAAAIEDWSGHWYILSDNTCVCLASGRIRGDTASTIQSITLGEKGKGYTNQLEWAKQRSVEVQRLDLDESR